MTEFMIHVERIVRPIQAMDGRKDRMREELLAHLETRFEHERAKQTDEASARRLAIASLGEPGQLRDELQASVSRFRRVEARLARNFTWQAPEPAWRFTLRAGMSVAALNFCGEFILFQPLIAFSLLSFDRETIFAAVRLMALISLLTGANVFVLGWLYFKMRDRLLGAFGLTRSWWRVVAYVLASTVMVECSLLVFLWAVAGQFGDDWSLLLAQSPGHSVVPLLGVFIAWFAGPAEVRHTEWECLDIRGDAIPSTVGD